MGDTGGGKCILVKMMLEHGVTETQPSTTFKIFHGDSTQNKQGQEGLAVKERNQGWPPMLPPKKRSWGCVGEVQDT